MNEDLFRHGLLRECMSKKKCRYSWLRSETRSNGWTSGWSPCIRSMFVRERGTHSAFRMMLRVLGTRLVGWVVLSQRGLVLSLVFVRVVSGLLLSQYNERIDYTARCNEVCFSCPSCPGRSVASSLGVLIACRQPERQFSPTFSRPAPQVRSN